MADETILSSALALLRHLDETLHTEALYVLQHREQARAILRDAEQAKAPQETEWHEPDVKPDAFRRYVIQVYAFLDEQGWIAAYEPENGKPLRWREVAAGGVPPQGADGAPAGPGAPPGPWGQRASMGTTAAGVWPGTSRAGRPGGDTEAVIVPRFYTVGEAATMLHLSRKMICGAVVG